MKHLNENSQIQIMRDAPVLQAVLKLSIPVVCGMMVQVLYNLVDTFFIGRLGDENQLAAANIAAPVLMLMMAVSTIVSTGAASYISRSLGREDRETAGKTLSTGLAICLGLALVITALGLAFSGPFVTLLGATPLAYPFAWQYVIVLIAGAAPIMLNYTMGQLLRSEGAVMPSIFGMLIGTVINIILDPIFIFVLKMGIQGAAIATVLGNVGALCFYIRYYASGKSVLRPAVRDVVLRGDIWGQTFAIGVPAAMSQFLMSGAMILCNNLAKPYGESVLGGMGISSKLMFVGTFIFMGFAAGCQPLVGYNFGAQNTPRVRAIIRTGMGITLGIGVVLGVLFWGFASGLVRPFAKGLADVEYQGARILRIQMLSFLVLGPQMIASTSIQAFGKAVQSLVLSIARQGLFYIPLLLTLHRQLGLLGLIWAQPAADALTLLLAMSLLALILKRNTEALEGAV